MPALWMRRSICSSSLALCLCAVAQGAVAQDLPAPSLTAPAAADLPLQLEVILNGEQVGLIGSFRLRPDGDLSASSDEIRALGLVAPPQPQDIALRSLPGVQYSYDAVGQRIFFGAAAQAIAPTVISLRRQQQRTPPSRDWGGLLNYTIAVDGGTTGEGWRPRAEGFSGGFEARAFGPFGLASTSFAGSVRSGQRDLVRLDSSWTRSDPEGVTVWRAGDFIGGGLSWTRPMRLAGVQFGRDFSTRPDLVTTPSPELSASAVAPSTLDVMLGNTVLLSRRVSAGPVQVTDLPTQGKGVARLVLRDAAGVEQVVTASYFATPELLRPGLLDFSAEAGFARYNYGALSNDYGPDLLASVTARYGLSDALTIQGHAEGGAGVANVGVGAVGRIGAVGIGSLALAAGSLDGKGGLLANAAFEGRLASISLAGQFQRTFGTYHDLASASAAEQWLFQGENLGRAPRRLAQISASAPLTFAVFERFREFPAFAVTYAFADAGGRRRSIMTSTLQYGLRNGVNLQAAAYASGLGRNNRGFYVAITAPLGGSSRSATAGVESTRGESSSFAEVRQQEQSEPGALGWRVRADQGRAEGVTADIVYRAPFARVSARAVHTAGRTDMEARADGAIVWMGRPYVAPDRVDGAFAAVDVGAPGVKVSLQNRPVGQTNRGGRILVWGLGGYDANLLAIDAGDLGLDLLAPRTRVTVSPPHNAGAKVSFGVTAAPAQAIVSLRLENGDVPRAGSMVSLNGGPYDQVVGYEGQLFLSDASAVRRLQVDLGDGEVCAADLDFNPKPGTSHATTVDCR